MRYQATGNIHMDFHNLFHSTIRYLSEQYGWVSVRKVMASMAQNVFRTMHDELKKGKTDELYEFWKYYYEREGGGIFIARSNSGLKMRVSKCPAKEYLRKQGIEHSDDMCAATRIFNEALAEGTPFTVRTECKGACSCVQEFVRKEGRLT